MGTVLRFLLKRGSPIKQPAPRKSRQNRNPHVFHRPPCHRQPDRPSPPTTAKACCSGRPNPMKPAPPICPTRMCTTWRATRKAAPAVSIFTVTLMTAATRFGTTAVSGSLKKVGKKPHKNSAKPYTCWTLSAASSETAPKCRLPAYGAATGRNCANPP